MFGLADCCAFYVCKCLERRSCGIHNWFSSHRQTRHPATIHLHVSSVLGLLQLTHTSASVPFGLLLRALNVSPGESSRFWYHITLLLWMSRWRAQNRSEYINNSSRGFSHIADSFSDLATEEAILPFGTVEYSHRWWLSLWLGTRYGHDIGKPIALRFKHCRPSTMVHSTPLPGPRVAALEIEVKLDSSDYAIPSADWKLPRSVRDTGRLVSIFESLRELHLSEDTVYVPQRGAKHNPLTQNKRWEDVVSLSVHPWHLRPSFRMLWIITSISTLPNRSTAVQLAPKDLLSRADWTDQWRLSILRCLYWGIKATAIHGHLPAAHSPASLTVFSQNETHFTFSRYCRTCHLSARCCWTRTWGIYDQSLVLQRIKLIAVALGLGAKHD
jgi:hypothetical protein